MSSLAAARADNFYIDPLRFDPSKRGRDSYNALANSHPLGERAKRLKTEGILVVRFELPHDGWCAGCGQHVARGVRFNADKKREGAYHSTPIYSFSMKCTACPSVYVIRTDPQHADYEYVSGIARQERAFEADDDPSVAVRAPPSLAAREARAVNPLYRLEAETDDVRKARSAHGRLAALAELQAARYGDDYASNAALREGARARRRADADAVAAGAARGLALSLPPAADEDEPAIAALVAAQHVARGDAAGSGGGGSKGAAASGASAGGTATAAGAATAGGGARTPVLAGFVRATGAASLPHGGGGGGRRGGDRRGPGGSSGGGGGVGTAATTRDDSAVVADPSRLGVLAPSARVALLAQPALPPLATLAAADGNAAAAPSVGLGHGGGTRAGEPPQRASAHPPSGDGAGAAAARQHTAAALPSRAAGQRQPPTAAFAAAAPHTVVGAAPIAAPTAGAEAAHRGGARLGGAAPSLRWGGAPKHAPGPRSSGTALLTGLGDLGYGAAAALGAPRLIRKPR